MIVRDEPTATIIAEALERYACGHLSTIAELQRHLNANPEISGQRKDGTIKIDTAKALLKRPIYAGYIDMPDWGIRMQKIVHEPLISLTTYQAIQDRLNGRAVAPIRKDTDAEFPLRGFIACVDCGHLMTAARSKGRSRYYPYYTNGLIN